jgi:hypothetical protein
MPRFPNQSSTLKFPTKILYNVFHLSHALYNLTRPFYPSQIDLINFCITDGEKANLLILWPQMGQLHQPLFVNNDGALVEC